MADVAENPVDEVKNDTSEEVEEVATETSKKITKESNDASNAEKDANTVEKNDAAEAKKESSEDDKSDGNITKRERAIIRQVEYYFSNANLRRDKFLLEQISKNEEGWVPLSVLLTFKRLSSLSTEPKVIIDAIIKSDEGLLEISEDKEKLRRHPERPIPEHNEEQRKEVQSRTAYAKGFPLETTMSELIDYFAPYEKVVHITMRKYLDKPTKTYKFKGSVFVTFDKKEQAQEFIEKDKVLYNERELIRKWQEKYFEDKKEESKSKEKSKKGKEKKEEDKLQLPKGSVVYFENSTDIVTRELLREAVEKVSGDWEIAYIDYSKGDKTGHIRFAEQDNGSKFLEKLKENKLKLSDELELVLRTLSEEEEKIYLAKAVEQMKSRRNYHNKNKFGHGNRKRRGGHDNRNDEKRRK
ncbi:la protein homolog [Ceratitis capitata]|uniref:la protein homolog n=1 Tax=Ceratitis capitata TaxID=7213 RepID=UPI00032A26B4|nr:la protein homolog [Ceratitis capitata]XP_020715652.1 la protein homolog [Ceratitis capitata]